MTQLTYEKEITGLIVVDPYNDFISEGGKIWDRIKGVAEGNQCIRHMEQVLQAARKAGVRVFYAMHRRYRPGDYENWKYIAPIQKAAWSRKAFEYGTWGGEIRSEFAPQPGDCVTSEHWGSSGFANTDLDLQLKRHGIDKVIVIGLIAHTCVEATVRYAAELGYEVTVVKDATASYSDDHMHAALDVNLPNYATAVVTADEISDAITGRQQTGGNMREVSVQRWSITSRNPFESVVAAVEAEIGKPQMNDFRSRLAAATTYEEMEKLVQQAVSQTGLMEFLRLDAGAVLAKAGVSGNPKSVRLVIGNPLIMQSMARLSPDAVSYAPVTVLIDQRADGVHLIYDEMASYLAPYGNAEALEIARDLDTKVKGLLQKASATELSSSTGAAVGAQC